MKTDLADILYEKTPETDGQSEIRSFAFEKRLYVNSWGGIS